MRKSSLLGFAALIVLVGFATGGCATGGYLGARPYPGPLGEVVAGNLALTCPGDVFVGPPINRCLRHLTNIRPQFAGYPMYVGGRSGRSLSRTEKIAVLGGAGAGVGYLVGRFVGAGTTKNQITSTIVGAGVGALVGALKNRGDGPRDVVAPPQQQQGGRYVGPDGVPVAIGTRPNRQGPMVSSPPSMVGEWRVSNRTSKRAELWDGEQFIARIEPGHSVQVSAPENSYKAVLLIPNRSGGLGQETAQIRSSENFNGWDILAPTVQ